MTVERFGSQPSEDNPREESVLAHLPREFLESVYMGACERIAELESDLEGRTTNEPGTSWEWLADGTLHIALTVDAVSRPVPSPDPEGEQTHG